MADLAPAANLSQVAHAVMQTTAPLKPVIQYVETGVSYMQVLIAAVVAFVAGGGLGWWYGGSATTAVKADLALAKTELNKLTSAVHLPPV